MIEQNISFESSAIEENLKTHRRFITFQHLKKQDIIYLLFAWNVLCLNGPASIVIKGWAIYTIYYAKFSSGDHSHHLHLPDIILICPLGNLMLVGRSMWPIFVQFRCPHSGTTFSLHESIDFYVLNTNSLVVTSRNPQFFCNLRSKYWYFYLNYVRKLHAIYNFCSNPILLGGGFTRLRAFLCCFDHRVYRVVKWNHTIYTKNWWNNWLHDSYLYPLGMLSIYVRELGKFAQRSSTV